MQESKQSGDQPPRQQAMERLRTRFGKARWKPSEQERGGTQMLDLFQLSFGQAATEDQTARPIDEADMRRMLDELRQGRRYRAADEARNILEPESDLEETEEEGPPSSKGAKRQLLAEIVSEHFRSGMHSWLNAVPIDHGLAETSLDELRQLRKEAAYRLKVVQEVARMLEREQSALDVQIRAKETQELGHFLT